MRWASARRRSTVAGWRWASCWRRRAARSMRSSWARRSARVSVRCCRLGRKVRVSVRPQAAAGWRLEAAGCRSSDSLIVCSSGLQPPVYSLQEAEVVEDDVELAGGLVDHDLLDGDHHQFLPFAGVEGGTLLLDDADEAYDLRDQLGREMNGLHLSLVLGDPGTHRLGQGRAGSDTCG